MEHIRRLWSFLKSKNETTVGNGDEVGHPEASRPIFATTTFVERDSSMSLEGDELFQVGTFVEDHFGGNPPHQPKPEAHRLELQQMKKERDDARQELANERADWNMKFKQDHRTWESRKNLLKLSEENEKLKREIAILKEAAYQETMKLREQLDAAKEEIDARIQHEVKITRELRASNEEKSRLQDQLTLVQCQMEGYKADFDQERKDRASAAGRYVEEEEQLKKIIQDLNIKLANKDLEIVELKNKLDKEKVQPAAETGNYSDQAKDYQRTIREVRSQRDETEARLTWPTDISVTNKRELKQQVRIDELEENCDLKIQQGELHRRQLEFEQHPHGHEHSISPHQGDDAYRHNASDKMTRSLSDSSLVQSTSNLPPPIFRMHPVHCQTICRTSTRGHDRSQHPENMYSAWEDEMYGETTNRVDVYAPILPHNRFADRDGMTLEIKGKAEELKKPPKGLHVADDVDERLWPYDPNLDCPHCGKRFRHGQIREFRYHIDDEHSPSMT